MEHFGIHAQELNNARIHELTISKDTTKIDTLSIIPSSFKITNSNGEMIDPSRYNIDYVRSMLILNQPHSFNSQKVILTYRVFPYNFSREYFNKKMPTFEADKAALQNPFLYQYEKTSTNVFQLDGLNKSGSISRGISFGNNQDVVVNSNFNLQLSGKLSEDIEVLAAITDNNIPIQPEGNTQQIQEFDKVFIQLFNDRFKLIAGDFELQRPSSYFMNFYRKAQGGYFTTQVDLSKKSTYTFTTAAAVSKGKYARNMLTAIEGNQGPYRLTGNENESYIVVLAGSERVYIDGELQTRGQNNDYIIDYNTAELTFTPTNLITKDKRIIVEFEYSDKHYSRSLFFMGNEFQEDRLKLRFNVFSEQDMKNHSIQPELTAKQKYLLSTLGDSIQNAFYPNIDSTAFSSDIVMYKKIDSLVAGVHYDSVFIYSTNPDSAFYRLGFTYIGSGKGNYVQEASAANGRVFKWVAPVRGVMQGEYEPVILLVTPKRKQLYTLSADYAISKSTSSSVEIAISDNDINTFSKINNVDNQGTAIKWAIRNKLPLNKNKSNLWSLRSEASYEMTDKYFSPIERYRSVEFERDWNVSQYKSPNDEHATNIKLALENPNTGQVNYQLNTLFRGYQYHGLQNMLNIDLNKKQYFLSFNGSIMNSKSLFSNTEYVKHKGAIGRKFKWITIGAREEQEHNSFFDVNTDTLISNSFAFNQWEVFFQNSDSSINTYSWSYKKRKDYLARWNSFKLATTAEELGLTFGLLKDPNNKINTTIAYRKLVINDSMFTDQQADRTAVGRIEYSLRRIKGAITSSTYYEIGSGMEVKKQYAYVRVPDGEGIYSWTDYNQDGIPQLDEFEIAVFKDQANYIKVFTPTNDFIKTYTNQFSEALYLNPAAVWSNAKGIKRFVSRLSNQMVYRVEHKTTMDDLEQAYNPFFNKISDSMLLSMNSSFRNTFYVNRNHSAFGMNVNVQSNKNKVLLVNGFESRMQSLQSMMFRFTIKKYFTLETQCTNGVNENNAAFFSTRNYHVYYYSVEPTLSYQPTTFIRVSALLKYADYRNTISELNEKSIHRSVGAEINYKILNKGSILIKANYLNLSYNASTNTPLAYEMLQGFMVGENATWSLSYQRNLSNNFQLNLVYDGRKSSQAKVIHVGSVQLRAYF